MCHRFPLYHRLFSGDEWVASVAQMLTEPEYRAVVEDFGAGNHALEQEIPRRELAGESAQAFFPKESTLVILHRIRKKGRPLPNAS